MKAAALLLALCVAGCGAGGELPHPDASLVDAVADAPGCTVAVHFAPAMPVAGATVVAQADVLGGSGVLTYQWSVERSGAPVTFSPVDASGRDISFVAATAGVYQVRVLVPSCSVTQQELNVSEPGANQRPVRLRFVPPPSLGVPPQERSVMVPGGSDFALGSVVLDPGTSFPVAVRTTGGAPLAAYLRFTARSTPDATVEAWSGGAGTAQVRLAGGHQDVLVVPDAALAPLVVTDWDPASGSLTVDSGQAWSGTVLDAGGAALAGARVSLESGGVPSTVGTTDAAGRFTLRWRDAAGVERLVVAPPAGRGLPRLELAVAITGDATIRYAAGAPRSLAGALVTVGGVAAADVDVALALTRPAAATIELPTSTVSAVGVQQLVLRTDGTGRLPAATAIAAAGNLYVASGGRGAVDLTVPLGASLDVAAPVAVTGRVVDSAGAAVAGARLRAALADELAWSGAPVVTAQTDASGGWAMTLAPGQPYTLAVTDPSARRAGARELVTMPGAGAVPAIALGPALRLTGELRATGIASPLRAVGVAALCQLGCAGLERERPLGEAVTDAAGRFVVAVPDPGVAQ